MTTTFPRAGRVRAVAGRLGLQVGGAALAVAVAAWTLLAAPAVAGGEAGDDSFGAAWGSRPAAAVRSATPYAAPAVACPQPAQAAALRQGMLEAVNARRRAAGLMPLRPEPSLTQAAAVVACDNARRGRMDHTALVEGDLRARIRAVNYRFHEAYEAIAFGYSAPERLAAAWHASAYHYPTLMTPTTQEAGIAVVQAADGRLWWAMISARPR